VDDYAADRRHLYNYDADGLRLSKTVGVVEHKYVWQGILGTNMFAYCGNNPVSREDSNGDIWVALATMAVGGVIGAAINTVSSAEREKRRANQKYAQKAIASAISYRYNTFANAAWGSSSRYAAGAGISSVGAELINVLASFLDTLPWNFW